MLTSTDENGQVTTFHPDPVTDRLNSIDQPSGVATPATVTTAIAYDDQSVQPAVTRSITTPGVSSAVQTTVSDGLGRTRFQKLLQGSTLISTVESQYDVVNRLVKTSNPYAPGETPVFTVTTSDELGRAKTVAPPSQGTQIFDYVGNRVTVTDPAGKKRRNFTDALGRLIQVNEPGPHPATAGSGTVAISGALQSNGGAPGSGSVTISGGERSFEDLDPNDPCNPVCGGFVTFYDSGSVSITVNGFTKSANYARFSTPSSIATALRTAFNNDPVRPVDAGGTGATITLTARANGASTNYPLSAASATFQPDNFGAGTTSFPATPSGSTLTGGGAGAAVDAGTVSITVNGLTKTANFNQSTNTSASLIASDLANQFNSDASSPVTGTANGGTVTVTSRTNGSNTNFSLAAGKTWDSAHFAQASFTPQTSGSALAGGDDAGISIETPVTTVYTYNVLDKLTQVLESDDAPSSQPSSQTRTYNYDSLGRLTSSTTPESGAVSFTYKDFSEVDTRTDARGVITSYTYDGLNRLKTIAYNVSGATGVPATPGVTFNYGASSASNNNGRLQQMLDGPGSETYTYNPAGGISQVVKVVGTLTRTTNYSYEATGALKSIGYPSGKLISYSYDSIGRLTRVGQGATAYLTINSADYTAAGQVKLMTMGNGVTGAYTFNDHLQLDSLKYKLGTTELLNLAYKYGAVNGGNNGQIQAIDNNTGGANKPRESVTYTYDDWSRLQRAQTNDLSVAPTGQPKAWALTWDYDRYGNRKNQNLVGGNLEVTAPQLSISTASNRITTTGYTYDANGNLTSDSLHNYTYDAENRLVTVDSTAASYAYDGNGIRVKRTTGTTVRTIIFLGMQPIAEYLGTSLRREYIYAASQLLVRLDTSGSTTTTTYSHPDHLSARLETNTSGVVTRNFGHLPFGDIWYETGTIEKFKFTSYERDTESQLDYAMFRFDSSRLGRFMSADPLAGSAASPQSLNRYSYVSNDPVNLGDSLGLGADGFFNCLLDGFLAPCGLGSAAVAAGAAGELPAGLSTVGFMNGYAYFLTAIDNGIGGTAFPINYWGISPSTAAFELGLPTSLSTGGNPRPDWPINPKNLILTIDIDCSHGEGGSGVREIRYVLKTTDGKKENQAIADKFSVFEHIAEAPWLAANRASGTDWVGTGNGMYQDVISTPPGLTYTQYFTVSPTTSPLGGYPVPIMNRDTGQTWGRNTIVTGGAFLVNGKRATKRCSP